MRINLDSIPARHAAVCAWYGPLMRHAAIAYIGKRLTALTDPSPGAKLFLSIWATTGDANAFWPAIRLMIAEIEANV